MHTGILSDLRTAISGELGLWVSQKLMSNYVRNSFGTDSRQVHQMIEGGSCDPLLIQLAPMEKEGRSLHIR